MRTVGAHPRITPQTEQGLLAVARSPPECRRHCATASWLSFGSTQRGVYDPAALGEALSRLPLSRPLASLDVSGQRLLFACTPRLTRCGSWERDQDMPGPGIGSTADSGTCWYQWTRPAPLSGRFRRPGGSSRRSKHPSAPNGRHPQLKFAPGSPRTIPYAQWRDTVTRCEARSMAPRGVGQDVGPASGGGTGGTRRGRRGAKRWGRRAFFRLWRDRGPGDGLHRFHFCTRRRNAAPTTLLFLRWLRRRYRRARPPGVTRSVAARPPSP